MVTTQLPLEATPDFEARCRAVLQQWQDGQLPFKEASTALTVLGQEATAQRHLANQGRVETLLGVMQGYRSNLNISIKHFENALDIYKRIGNERRIASTNLNLGEVHRQKGDFTRARELFHSAYENAVRLNEIRVQTIARGNEGHMLLSMGRIEEARTALLEALELTNQWPEDSARDLAGLLCEVYYSLAVIYLSENNLLAAWEQARKALATAREINQPLVVGQASRTMGEVLTSLETPPEEQDANFSINPDDYFKSSIEAFQSVDAEGEMARTMHVHARSLAKRGRRVPAAKQLQRATLIFARLGMVDDAAKAAESQAEIF